MNLGDAIASLEQGRRVARTGWNGAGMWLVLVPGSAITVTADRPLGLAAPELIGQQTSYHPHVDMWTADGTLVPWVPSQSDLLGKDWVVIPESVPDVL